MKARALLERAVATLAGAGLASPRVDAELLLGHILDVDRSKLLTIDEVDEASAARFGQLIEQRTARVPLQYLTGQAPFRFATIAVGPGVFIPRPETELLVDAVLPMLRGRPAPIAVDLCAGSGALALALAQEVSAARVLAVERSQAALEWLRRNCAGTRVEIVAGDVADAGLLADLDGLVDAIVSNPPYVPSVSLVGAEVAHDPADAVFAGADGLAVIPAVLALAARLLAPHGVLALEHDDTHATVVPALLHRHGEWADVADHRDLAGLPRYATARRRSPVRQDERS